MYFKNFPYRYYDLTGDVNANPVVIKDIFFRFKMRDNIQNNTIIYYPYEIKDGESPEIIAHKYYKDINKHWIILMANNIMNIDNDWPLDYNSFLKYINKKYGSMENAETQYLYYYKNITKTTSLNTTIDTITIGSTEYANTASYSSNSYTLPGGESITITIETGRQTAFEYEIELNEKKRNIKIIDVKYVEQIEQELVNLK